MKFAFALVAGALPVLFAQTARVNSSFPESATIYVSARDGSDSWTGRFPSPTKTDGPLATFEKARQAVQNLNKTGLSGGAWFSLAAAPISFPRPNI